MRLHHVLLVGATVSVLGCGPSEKPAAKPTGVDAQVAELMNAPQAKSSLPAEQVAKPEEVVPPPPPAVTAARSTAPVAEVDVRTVDFDGFEAEIGKFEGKTVVLDCWATWCTICKEKFPEYLDLKSQFAGREDIVFATLANDPADKEDDVRDFLTKSGAAMVCYLLDEDPADFASHFNVNGVPAYLIFSPEGELVFRAGKVEELEAKLKELAAPKS